MRRTTSIALAVAVVAVTVLPLLAVPLVEPELATLRRAAAPGPDVPAPERAPLLGPARETLLHPPRPPRPLPERPRSSREPLRSPSYLLPFLGEAARSSVP